MGGEIFEIAMIRRPIMPVSMNRRQSAQHRGPHLDKVDTPAITAPAADGSKLHVGSSVSSLWMESDRVGGWISSEIHEGGEDSSGRDRWLHWQYCWSKFGSVQVRSLAETEPRISELETGVRRVRITVIWLLTWW